MKLDVKSAICSGFPKLDWIGGPNYSSNLHQSETFEASLEDPFFNPRRSALEINSSSIMEMHQLNLI
jgi:hypothetical protein